MPIHTPQHHFIGGEFVTGRPDGKLLVMNPATAEIIATIPRGSAADVHFAVEAAAKAQRAWAQRSPGVRAEFMYRLADGMQRDLANLTELESLNAGKPLMNARQEIQFAIDLIRFCAGAGRCMEGKSAGEYLPEHTSIVRREPLGVVAGITPWNYPIVMLAYKLGAALATGNAMIIKPAEQTPLSTLRVAELSASVLPPGVFNVVVGDHVAGEALVRHPLVRLVSLTGSTETGRIVAREAAETLKRVHLELGGKAPVLVLDDADLNAVASGMRKGAFYNSGQDCTAATRILAGPRIYSDLIEALRTMAEDVRVGAPQEGDAVEMGPLITAAQQQRVQGFVARSQKLRRTILAGGCILQRDGFFFAPTLITDVHQEDEIIQSEVFGPVLTVQRFESDSDAVRLANGTPYGLGASVWTQDLDRALTLSRALEVGTVWVNCHDRVTPEMPHGGMKASGYGKDLSMYSLESYTHIKHVMFHHKERQYP